MTASPNRYWKCCSDGCPNYAQYEIRWGDGHEQYTHACSEHLAKLLEPGVVNHVYELTSDG